MNPRCVMVSGFVYAMSKARGGPDTSPYIRRACIAHPGDDTSTPEIRQGSMPARKADAQNRPDRPVYHSRPNRRGTPPKQTAAATAPTNKRRASARMNWGSGAVIAAKVRVTGSSKTADAIAASRASIELLAISGFPISGKHRSEAAGIHSLTPQDLRDILGSWIGVRNVLLGVPSLASRVTGRAL